MVKGLCGIITAAAVADFIVNVTHWIGQQPPHLLLLYSLPLMALYTVLGVWSYLRVAEQRRPKIDEYYAEIRDTYLRVQSMECRQCETRGNWKLEEKEGMLYAGAPASCWASNMQNQSCEQTVASVG